jgi:hypothetical protein
MANDIRNGNRKRAILHSARLAWILSAAFAVLAGHGAAQAQVIDAPAPPMMSLTDENGYDVVSRSFEQHIGDLSIGNGMSRLAHVARFYQGSISQGALRDNFVGVLQTIVPAGTSPNSSNNFAAGCLYAFSFDTQSECFSATATATGAPSGPMSQNGSTLTVNSDGTFVYTARDGAKYSGSGFILTFTNSSGTSYLGSRRAGQVTRVTYPNGFIVNIHWKYAGGTPDGFGRIQSVTTNTGLQIKYNYVSNTTSNVAWYYLANIVAINNALEYCAPLVDTCNLTQPWKSASYSLTNVSTVQSTTGPININYYTITDQAGAQTRYTILGNGGSGFVGGNIVAIKPATATVDQYTIKYCWPSVATQASPYIIPCASNFNSPDLAHSDTTVGPYVHGGVAAYTREGLQYNFRVQQNLAGQGPGAPLNTQTNYEIGPDTNISASFQWRTGFYSGSLLTNAIFSDGSTALYSGDSKQQLIKYNNGQTATFDYIYDARGNLSSQKRTAAAGSNVANLVTSAAYPTPCSNLKTCNKPSTVTDPNGKTTTYTYDPVSGGVLTVTQPSDGITPQMRYSYVQRSAQYLNSAGTTAVSPDPIWVLSTESFCRSGAPSGSGCALAGDEVVKTYQYGPAIGPQDLLVHGIVSQGNGLTVRTCFSYDINGNKISETSPNANLTECP